MITAAAAVFLAAALPVAGAAAGPHRIVSLNVCTDELVLRLAKSEHVASVTWLSRNPKVGNVAGLADSIPVNHGLAEEIVPLNPDIVLAGIYTTRAAVALLKRVGTRLVEFDVPHSVEDVRRQIRQIALLVGESRRGEQMIAGMDLRLAALPALPSPRRLRAIVLNPNGFTTGYNSLPADIIRLAGLTNVGAELGISGPVPLEIVATSRIDILIVSASRDGPPALATELLRHPVLQNLPGKVRVVVMPARLWSCGGPAIVDAVARLREAARQAIQDTGTP